MNKNSRHSKLEQLEKFGWHEFWDLCQEIGILNQQADIYEIITKKYAAEDRCYHTIKHVLNCLHLLEKVKDQVEDVPAVKLALWFHDIEKTEAASARTMRDVIKGRLLVSIEIEEVAKLIMDTVHPSNPQTNDGKIISDIDLFGLAATYGQFHATGQLVRQEFPQLTDKEFYRGRLDFFSKILAEQIFKHDCFKQFETKARANLEKESAAIRELLGS